MNPHGCIAHPCPVKRAKDSGFCKAHKAEHHKSPWRKCWLIYMADCAKVGHKNAVFSPPKEKK